MHDRKFYSKAPTILRVSTPTKRSSLTPKSAAKQRETPKSLNNANKAERRSLRKSISSDSSKQLLKTALITETERIMNLAVTPPCSPSLKPVTSARKSILKTPGTAKGAPKNVIFNEKLRIKKFNFIIDSDDEAEENNKNIKKIEESTIEKYEMENEERRNSKCLNLIFLVLWE